MKKKVKRYNQGGKTEEEYKKEGIAASNKEGRVGFFERLLMGNIDSPYSEAYYKLGAGRGRMEEESRTKVPESANKSSDYSGRNAKSYEDNGMNVPHSGTPSKNIVRDTPKQGSSDSSSSSSSGSSGSSSSGSSGSSSSGSSGSSSSSSYMPKSTYKQQAIGDATNDNIVVKRPAAPRKEDTSKKPDAKPDASKKPNVSKTSSTRGLGMAGSDRGSGISSSRNKKIGEAIEGTFTNAFKRVDPETIREERRRIVEQKRKRAKAGESATDNMKEYGMKKGGSVSSASSRGDGIAQRGKTRGRLV